MHYFALVLILLLGACQPSSTSGHSHDGEEGHGHPHPEDETLTTDTTIWTDQTELFVEFPVLVVGQVSRFAAHFTVLDGHQPVREGSVTVSLIQGDKGIRQQVEAPSSPGIFTPSLQPKAAGRYQLIFDLQTPAYSDRMVMNNVPVFASEEAATAAMQEGEEPGGAITFLKEQAWKIDFHTEMVETAVVHDVISTSGTWKVAPSDYQTVAARMSGIVNFRSSNLTPGTRVSKGQVLMSVRSDNLTTNNLSAEIAQAQATYEQTRSAYERKKTLFDSQVVPKAELEEAEQAFEIARSAYETLQAGYESGGKTVVAPTTGYIRSVAVANGQFVEQGASLISIGRHTSSLLEVQVSPSYAPQLGAIQDLWYQPGPGHWSSLQATGGSIISVGREVDAENPLLSIFARIQEDVLAVEGGFTEVQLAVGTAEPLPVVPVSALLEDYGNYSVIVQLSGELFERRPVTIGNQNGDRVAIRSGLQAGEVIVTTGNYQVKMASMSGQVPAHGHSH